MVRKKKKSPVLVIAVLLLLCVGAGVAYLAVNLFTPLAVESPKTTPEAAESCAAKITKMLIDETLAFKYKNTKEVPFNELEINSWLKENPGHDRVPDINVRIGKDRLTFEGLLTPFVRTSSEKSGRSYVRQQLKNLTVAFQISTVPQVRSNRIFFEPKQVRLGKLTVPANLMPEILNSLNLNPFEKQIRTIKDVHIRNGSLIVTVYAD